MVASVANGFSRPVQADRSDAGTALSPRWLLLSAAIVIFILVASNGVPVRTSSGFYIALLAPLMIIGRGVGRVLNMALSRANWPVTSALLLFLLGNLISTVATPTDQSVLALALRCFIPLTIYLALVHLTIRRKDAVFLVMALCAGCAFMFFRGLLAYYQEWGVPDLQTVLWSRYNLVRIAGYAEATVGNVGHMGSYVALVVPALLQAMVLVRGPVLRATIVMVVLVGIANLIVSGSRTGLVVLLLALFVFVLSLGLRRATVAFLGGIIVVVATLPNWLDLFADAEFLDRYLPILGTRGVDVSANERVSSIEIGWNTFLENIILGVGPDMSFGYNMYGVPHQSFVHQFSELGIFGGFAFVWLNVVVIAKCMAAFPGMRTSLAGSFRFLWLLGPSCWLIYGMAAGITFNMSFALVWVGVFHAMLALASANILPDFQTSPRPRRKEVALSEARNRSLGTLPGGAMAQDRQESRPTNSVRL